MLRATKTRLRSLRKCAARSTLQSTGRASLRRTMAQAPCSSSTETKGTKSGRTTESSSQCIFAVRTGRLLDSSQRKHPRESLTCNRAMAVRYPLDHAWGEASGASRRAKRKLLSDEDSLSKVRDVAGERHENRNGDSPFLIRTSSRAHFHAMHSALRREGRDLMDHAGPPRGPFNGRRHESGAVV